MGSHHRLKPDTLALASVCYLLGVMPSSQVADATRAVPNMQRGEALCAAFETYRQLLPGARISFEHAVFLVVALARGDELRAAPCTDCTGLIVIDRYSPSARRCMACENSSQGRLALG